ncbi:hypothetical protein B0H13DRAFT_2282263 [Mycena leptocephala]|nr:hypothetical protein B0H13DRAFT_2282263 [Mycena leptocephala]
MWVGRYTDEDNVQVGGSAIKGDVRAWCETDKGIVHKARWGVGKQCQVARGIAPSCQATASTAGSRLVAIKYLDMLQICKINHQLCFVREKRQCPYRGLRPRLNVTQILRLRLEAKMINLDAATVRNSAKDIVNTCLNSLPKARLKGVRRHPGFGSGFDDSGFGRGFDDPRFGFKDRGSAFDERGSLFD